MCQGGIEKSLLVQTADEPGIQTAPDRIIHLAEVEEGVQQNGRDQESLFCWVTRYTLLNLHFFISRGKINIVSHLSQTIEPCYVSCTLCWHLIRMFVTALPCYRGHSKTKHMKTPSQTWRSMTHIDGDGTFLMALFHSKASGAYEISKIQMYLLDLAEQLLRAELLISIRGWEGPNEG